MTVITDFVINLHAGLRLAFMLPLRGGNFRVSLFQGLLLFLLSLALNFFYDFWNAGPDRVFNVYGLNYQATLYLLFILSVVAVCALARAKQQILALVVVLLAVAPTIFIVYSVVLELGELQSWLSVENVYRTVFYVYLFWYALIVARSLTLLLPIPRPGIVFLLLLYMLINIGPWLHLPGVPMWYAAPVTVDPGRPRPVPAQSLETLLARQPRLVNDAVGVLHGQRPGIVDMYFLGVAGYSSEDVFMNEVLNARRLLDERFATRGRSLTLINNGATQRDTPLATTGNLRLALTRLATVLDGKEDVLFLLLSSHGIEDQGLETELNGFELTALTPAALHEMLNAAGIERRVIVVSACYSGQFLEALQDQQTMIMTAARSDRSSFGCGHDGDFTYFGAALFGKHLASHESFEAAFSAARDEIIERERNEDRTPSEPQIFSGPALQPVLEELMQRLRSQGRDGSNATEGEIAQAKTPGKILQAHDALYYSQSGAGAFVEFLAVLSTAAKTLT